MSGAKDHCNRISSCWWLSTTDPADCVWQSTSTSPPEPGCCYLHSSQNPMSGWRDRCTEFHTESDCTTPSDMYGQSRCSWSEAPDGHDCENFWPTTTEASGCCASDSERAYERCSGSSSKWECNAMSSCHWIEGDVHELLERGRLPDPGGRRGREAMFVDTDCRGCGLHHPVADRRTS